MSIVIGLRYKGYAQPVLDSFKLYLKGQKALGAAAVNTLTVFGCERFGSVIAVHTSERRVPLEFVDLSLDPNDAACQMIIEFDDAVFSLSSSAGITKVFQSCCDLRDVLAEVVSCVTAPLAVRPVASTPPLPSDAVLQQALYEECKKAELLPLIYSKRVDSDNRYDVTSYPADHLDRIWRSNKRVGYEEGMEARRGSPLLHSSVHGLPDQFHRPPQVGKQELVTDWLKSSSSASGAAVPPGWLPSL